jgi:uncharacterized protein YndB with AHSA1/START domain
MSRLTRLLIALAVAMLIGLAILFLIGGRPMHFSSQTEIDAPPELVFRFLTDPVIWERVSGTARIRPLTEGGHQVGAKAQLTVDYLQKHWVILGEVLESTPGERVIYALETEQLTARSDIRLQEIDGRTTLRHAIILNPRGWLRLWAPFSRRPIQEGLDTALGQLKTAVERGAASIPPEQSNGTTP